MGGRGGWFLLRLKISRADQLRSINIDGDRLMLTELAEWQMFAVVERS